MVCLALMCLEVVAFGAPAAYASGPGGNVSDPVVRAVDIAKPAVVRIITQVIGQLTVNFSNGQSATFPLTPQNGFNGYPLDLSGSGAFISAHGDLLTADHVVSPPKPDLDQYLDQLASQDVANYINQHLKPAQPATPDGVAQQLASGQLQSTSQYQQPLSRVYLSTDFSGPLNATSFQGIPASQFADVTQIKQQSATNQKDVAIIHVNGMDNMPMLQLGNSASVQQQDNLTIIGFPGNGDVGTSPTDLLTSSINQVLVSSIKTTDTGAPVIQVGGNVEHGDSGGPALDSNGQVVGIVSFGLASSSSGNTSFLQASSSAKPLIQASGIDTTPSQFQQAWSKAFNDYAATVPGHWHQSMHEFQQIASSYPQFKAVSPFLQYVTQQAQTETQTQESSNASGSGSTSGIGSGGLNPVLIIIGGVVVLMVLIGGGVAASRRRKPAPAGMGYGGFSAPGYNQSYGTLPANASGFGQRPVAQSPSLGIPQTPGYSAQAAQQQPYYGGPVSQPSAQISPVPQPAYRQQSVSQAAPAYPSPQVQSAPQQSYRPQPAPSAAYPPAQAPSAPQQSYRPAQPSQPSAGSNLSAFGAPQAQVPVTPQPDPSASDVTMLRPGTSSSSQWRTWPCGHVNRDDARFCGTCGESAPPAPLVRRVEQ